MSIKDMLLSLSTILKISPEHSLTMILYALLMMTN